MISVVEKLVEDGLTYAVESRYDGEVAEGEPTHVVKSKADPTLRCTNAPASAAAGATVELEFALFDLDGAARADNRQVTLVIAGQEHAFELAAGHLSLSVTMEASGQMRIAIRPEDVVMEPVVIEVS